MASPSPSPPRPIFTGSPESRVPLSRWVELAPVTATLIMLNVALFVVELLLSQGASLMHLPAHDGLALGASYSLAIAGENRWETLVTACFLHDGFLHLAFNMLALSMAGPIVERAVGSTRMAPLYLVAGALGNFVSMALFWRRGAQMTVGASGAILGLVAAACIVGWRVQGWRGPLTQAMARWLGFVLVFGLLSSGTGGRVDNAAHLGGMLAGAAIAFTWRRNVRYSRRATAVVLGGCSAVLVACIAAVIVHDRSDPFAALDLQAREAYTAMALAEGRCGHAYEGLRAVERLRKKLAPVTSLRRQVEATCGHVDASILGG